MHSIARIVVALLWCKTGVRPVSPVLHPGAYITLLAAILSSLPHGDALRPARLPNAMSAR